MSSTPYIILISGASRGLGKGLVERYLARPNHVVIAANRDPNSSTSKSLHEISKAEGTRLIIVKYDGAADDGASGIPKDLAAEGIDHLDLVIANAGMAYIHPSVSDLKLSDFQNHIATNVYGTVLLYQATLSLLKKAHDPKWVTMGSSAGSITATPPVPNAVYGPSKAAVHWLTRRIDVEEALLTAFVMDPGFVATDGGHRGAVKLVELTGMHELMNMLISVEESTTAMVKRIDEATKQTHGGKFVRYSGENAPW